MLGVQLYPGTTLCDLFAEISEAIWKKISRHHDFDVHVSEIGLTGDIMYEVINWALMTRSAECYILDAVSEKRNGNDLELYIQNDDGDYIHYALQAKVLKTNKRYGGLATGNTARNPGYQWDKLEDYAKREGCIPLYLLYNGDSSFSVDCIDQCINVFDERQYGCSILRPSVFKWFFDNGTTNPEFRDIHPRYARPWSVLACCRSVPSYMLSRRLVETYRNKSYQDIQGGLDRYRRITQRFDRNERGNDDPLADKSKGNEEFDPFIKVIINKEAKNERSA